MGHAVLFGWALSSSLQLGLQNNQKKLASNGPVHWVKIWAELGLELGVGPWAHSSN